MVATPQTSPAPVGPIDYPEVVNNRRRALVMVALATLLAASIGALVFAAFLYAEFLTRPLQEIADFFFAHSALAVAAATSPLFAALLVGYGYMQRAMRRRAAERQTGEVAKAGRPDASPDGTLH